ncbi:MAG: peptidylprolyl isomerase [Candidatus Bathyarchaeota archaeon]
MVVEKGNHVKVHFTAKVGGQVFDTTLNRNPLEFNVGEGKIIQGFDEAVIGLEKGEKKTVAVPPEKAFGHRQDSLVEEVTRDSLKVPPEQIQEGKVVTSRSEKGEVRIATIRKVEGEQITLDYNHPLAGQTLDFEIEIVDIQK